MALAAIAAAIFFAMGLVFTSEALQAAKGVTTLWELSLQRPVVQLWSLVLTATGLLSLGIAFLCFTATKFKPHNHERYRALRERIRSVGLIWVRIAFAIAGLWLLLAATVQVTQ